VVVAWGRRRAGFICVGGRAGTTACEGFHEPNNYQRLLAVPIAARRRRHYSQGVQVVYVRDCNADCQRNHWSKHKKECKQRAAELRDETLFKDPPRWRSVPSASYQAIR
jgi:hypothetical protein